jgi:hypothetical protein
MFRKIAKLSVAVVLLGNGAAFAAASGVDENAPLSIPLPETRVIVSSSASATPGYPSSASEAPAFTFSAQAMDIGPERLGATYGSVFPSSVNETGVNI